MLNLTEPQPPGLRTMRPVSVTIADMRAPILVAFAYCSFFMSSGCKNNNSVPAAKTDVTVVLRDGTSVAGEIVESTPQQITLKAYDGTTRVLEMRNVRTVDYGQAGSQAVAPAPPLPATQTGRLERVHNDPPPTPPRFHPAESHISTTTFLLPIGTQIQVRTDENIDSRTAAQGQTFAAEIYRDVMDAAGDVVLPQGANVQLAIRSASRGGRVTGSSDLLVDLASVSAGGRQYVVVSSDIERRGKQGLGANRRTAEYVGGTSALGAVIGAIAGHGKGAAIGAGAGAGAGVLVEVLTKGSSVRIPPETLLTFQLEQPLRIAPTR